MPGLLVSDRLSLSRPWVPNHSYCWEAALGLWLQKVPTRWSWWPSLHLFHPLGCQEDSRLVGWSNRWPFLYNTQLKTQQVARSRGQWCGDIELADYLANESGPAPLVVDLRTVHKRFGSSSDPILNGHLHYPNDMDRSLNEVVADKIRNITQTIIVIPPMLSPLWLLWLVRLEGYIVNLCSIILTDSSGNWRPFCRFRCSTCSIDQ
jgi:hypothetical protein